MTYNIELLELCYVGVDVSNAGERLVTLKKRMKNEAKLSRVARKQISLDNLTSRCSEAQMERLLPVVIQIVQS